VKIYDVNTEQRITFIDRPKGSPKADLYRCSLCWEDPHTLLIGWADMVKVATIKVSFFFSLFPFLSSSFHFFPCFSRFPEGTAGAPALGRPHPLRRDRRRVTHLFPPPPTQTNYEYEN
jgi:hypothetical protein